MASQQLGHILKSSDKDVHRTAGPNGILANLYRKMLVELNVGPGRFSDFLREYVTDPRHGIAQTQKDLTTARGNLMKELSRSGMTFKVFLKGMRFLQVRKFDFCVRCHYYTGSPSIHQALIDFGSRRDHQVVSPNGILADLFRQMLVDLDIGPGRFSDLLDDYVNDPRNGVPRTPKDFTTARGNLTKELSRDGMTFKVFLKGLRFLQVIKVEFSVRCHYYSGRVSIHGTTVEFAKRPELLDESGEPVRNEEETASLLSNAVPQSLIALA
ncbi:hypothetical protein HDG34_003226 [Paraburkholderia sp. HC6.4b]|uniref:hypothetical protein n=1 Tax=unclassified Paraburkholderia TaxID=2615204 RepID=UPI00161F22AC|nr:MULTISPECIES: hypothetical protein [unclassified Paraburkholderia]MBB5409285.1 hypothetical protein [Paraburkholderia sp. HC6.4b]MBB5451013.1 hypothetical protein [Paraburkholderia sp. Kb1A]